MVVWYSPAASAPRQLPPCGFGQVGWPAADGESEPPTAGRVLGAAPELGDEHPVSRMRRAVAMSETDAAASALRVNMMLSFPE